MTGALTLSEPRFSVQKCGPLVFVVDRRSTDPVAEFHARRHPGAVAAARAEADRLNREVTS